MNKVLNIGLAALMALAIGACEEKKPQSGSNDAGNPATESPEIEAPGKNKYVKIGTQVWMARNLNDASKGGRCYEDKPENCEKYGRLYNWNEAMNACPEGWHLPSSKEWDVLVDLAGGNGVAGKKLKAKAGWSNECKRGIMDSRGRITVEDICNTDEFGFSGLPGGLYSWDGHFYHVGREGYWWSSSEDDNDGAYYRYVDSFNNYIPPNNYNKTGLFSVRCVESQPVEWTASSTLAPQGKTSYDAVNLGNGDNSNTWCEGVEGQGIGERVNAQVIGFTNTHIKSFVIVNGFAKNQTTWKNNSRVKTLRLYAGGEHLSDFPISDIIKPQTINLPETLPLSQSKLDLSFEIAEVYPGSKFDDLCITGISFDIYAVDSRDGQTYRTAKIGTQTWMAQNLNFKTDDSKCYGNKDSNCAKYGRLYVWNEAMNACPSGWHLPSDDEWQALVDFAGGNEVAGKKLKAKSGWNKDEGKSGNGTDDFGFSALPGGNILLGGNSFGNVGNYGNWWSSTNARHDYFWVRSMGNHHDGVGRGDYNTPYSIRCVKD